MSCQNCPLMGSKQIKGYGNPHGIAIVCESPTQADLAYNKPFSGTQGQFFKKVLQAVGFDLKDLYFTTACKCQQPTKQNTVALEMCKESLLEELQHCSKVLLLGNSSILSLYPEKTTVSKCRGRAVWNPELGKVVIATYNIGTILNEHEFFTDMLFDLQKLKACGTTKESVAYPTPGKTHFVNNIAALKQAIIALSAHTHIAVDLETTSLDPRTGHILLMGLRGCLEEDYHISGSLLQNLQVRNCIKTFLERRDITFIGANICFDSMWLIYHYGIDWKPTIDTMLAHYCLDERSSDEDRKGVRMAGVHSLKTIARERYNAPPWDNELKQILKKLKSTNYGDVPLELLSKYLAFDTLYTWLLGFDLVAEMQADEVAVVHDTILVPAAWALRDIQLQGIHMDIQHLQKMDTELQETSERLLLEIREIAKAAGVLDFNPASPKQLAVLLFDILGCQQIKARSTDESVLKALAPYYEICNKLLEYRKVEKSRGTYTAGLLQRISDDGRLRGEFLLHGTVTGRLSAANPNLQNIPRTGPLKQAFCATPGWTMFEADYTQLELRIATWYSKDEELINCYVNDADLHRLVASEVFKKVPENVTSEERNIAKTVDFGIIYGRGAPALAFGPLQCEVKTAQKYIDDFLAGYPQLKDWLETTQHEALQDGFVSTPFGRKRRFPLILDDNKYQVMRQAVNAPIQSMASDICLQALIRVHNLFDPAKQRILFTVHDSIVFECLEGFEEETVSLVKTVMEQWPIASPVPLKVDIKTGKTWGTMKNV